MAVRGSGVPPAAMERRQGWRRRTTRFAGGSHRVPQDASIPHLVPLTRSLIIPHGPSRSLTVPNGPTCGPTHGPSRSRTVPDVVPHMIPHGPTRGPQAPTTARRRGMRLLGAHARARVWGGVARTPTPSGEAPPWRSVSTRGSCSRPAARHSGVCPAALRASTQAPPASSARVVATRRPTGAAPDAAQCSAARPCWARAGGWAPRTRRQAAAWLTAAETRSPAARSWPNGLFDPSLRQ